MRGNIYVLADHISKTCFQPVQHELRLLLLLRRSRQRTHGSYGIMAEDTLCNLIKKSLFQAVSHICFAFQGGEPTLCGLHFLKM